jgi:hypothetical protein
MIINPETELALFNQRQRELINNAEIARLLEEGHGRETSLEDHILRKTGDLLIAIGLLLKAPDRASESALGHHPATRR